MISNDLSEIFFALKNHHDKKLVLYKKIAGISLLSRNYLCCNTFMTSLNDVVSIYKGITIDNVVSLNVYENPSFCCTLFVFITCYLGEVNENPSDEEYTFKKINGNPVKSAFGLLEDYWFGHRIQHGSGNQVNVTLTTGYEIKAKKKFKLVKSFFWITTDP